jgi:hypothetical protein
MSDNVLIRLFDADGLENSGNNEFLPDSEPFTLRNMGASGVGGDSDRIVVGRNRDGCLPELGGDLDCSIT